MSAEATLDQALFDEGMKVRREVLGAEYVNNATQHVDELTVEFQKFMTTYCWGGIWTDERLERAQHSLLVLGITAALGKRVSSRPMPEEPCVTALLPINS